MNIIVEEVYRFTCAVEHMWFAYVAYMRDICNMRNLRNHICGDKRSTVSARLLADFVTQLRSLARNVDPYARNKNNSKRPVAGVNRGGIALEKCDWKVQDEYREGNVSEERHAFLYGYPIMSAESMVDGIVWYSHKACAVRVTAVAKLLGEFGRIQKERHCVADDIRSHHV